MKFIHTDLGMLNGGEIVEVTLSGSQANIKLMTSSNFQLYKSNRNHNCYVGLATKSPVKIPIPSAGHWHITIDLGGYPGTIESSIKIIR